MPVLLSPPAPLIIGHRGASAQAPENTLAAFTRALDDGADGLEFDVRLSRDHVPVVIHDETLRRTGLRDDRVAALSSDELCQADVGTWFNLSFPEQARAEYTRERLPTLAHVLQVAGQRSRALYVELKIDQGAAQPTAKALATAVVGVVRRQGLMSRVIIESFTLEAIQAVKGIAPEIRTAALFERKMMRPFPSGRTMIQQALACGADEIALQHTLARSRTIDAAKRAGLRALVWTVDDTRWAAHAQTLGLCALITNYPARMRAAMNKLRDNHKDR